MKEILVDMAIDVPNADKDGEHSFLLSKAFWELWREDRAMCKLYGFFIEKDGDDWVGVYRPFAPFAEGTKRLAMQKEGNI